MITNYVTVKDVVNIVLAAGGTAICAAAPEEAAEITAAADGLLINIGTPSAKGCTAMLLAGKEANRRGIPVVLDPVGAGASSFRDGILSQLLEQIHFTCIRGNATEVAALCHMGSNHSGVEAADDFLPPECIQQLAVKTGAIIVVTGETDIITDGKKILTEKKRDRPSEENNRGRLYAVRTDLLQSCCNLYGTGGENRNGCAVYPFL